MLLPTIVYFAPLRMSTPFFTAIIPRQTCQQWMQSVFQPFYRLSENLSSPTHVMDE